MRITIDIAIGQLVMRHIKSRHVRHMAAAGPPISYVSSKLHSSGRPQTLIVPYIHPGPVSKLLMEIQGSISSRQSITLFHLGNKSPCHLHVQPLDLPPDDALWYGVHILGMYVCGLLYMSCSSVMFSWIFLLYHFLSLCLSVHMCAYQNTSDPLNTSYC